MQDYIIAILFYFASTVVTTVAGRIVEHYWPPKREERDGSEQHFSFYCAVYDYSRTAPDEGKIGSLWFPEIPTAGALFLSNGKRFRVRTVVLHSSADGVSREGRDADLYVKEEESA